MPASLPTVPWLEFAAAYIGAMQWQETGGDFYDVFPPPTAGPSRSATSAARARTRPR